MMKKLKTILVEDERLPRLSLLKKLEDFRHIVEVIDACDSYDTARESILLHRPDLLILDIQLHGYDSIKLLNELKQTITLPYVIFTTAYSDRQYLMSAIKFSAIDYLMKPIDKGELAHALAKVIDRAEADSEARNATVTAATGKIGFKSVNGRVFISADDIAYIKADRNYANIITFHGQEMVLENLLSLEQRLCEKNSAINDNETPVFARVDRSTIVNLSKVYRLNNMQNTCILQSPDGATRLLKISNNGIKLLMDLLS